MSCAWPLDSHCIPCASYVPSISTPAQFALTNPQRVQNYENYDNTRLWTYNAGVTIMSDAVAPTGETQQVLADLEMIWLALVSLNLAWLAWLAWVGFGLIGLALACLGWL